METNSLVGKQLAKYKIQAEIGRGGMGAVYLGYDPALDRHVAVKVLPPHLAWQTELVERFLREARTAARLRHPNIVTIYDVGQEGENYYFVMEYLEGETLTHLIQQRGTLSPQEVLAMLRPLAEALDYAHQRGLIHRDIKPANIVVGPGGHVTLTDFGIARATQETRLTATGAVVGTPAYMSTEQAQGQQVEAPSDQYSLAVVAYEMLSGQVPFDADSTMALLYKIIHEPPPPICAVRPDLPVAVQEVFNRALAKNPAERYPTVSAFVSALEGALGGQAVPTFRATTGWPTATTPSGAPTTPRRRVPAWVWALGGLALAALFVGGWLLLNSGGQAQPTPTPTLRQEVAAATQTPTPTVSPTPTPRPTDTPDLTATYEHTLFLTLIAPTATAAPTHTPTASATATRTPRPTARPTATSRPTTAATPTRTLAPTSPATPATRMPTLTPRAAASPAATGALITFEQMGSWRRGDQPYGELTQTQEQVHTGSYAAKLAYNFPAAADDFVVFIQSLGLSGQPNTVGAWVYGDGSGHYVNVWIQDAQNEIWSVHLGKVSSAGWRQMVGTLAAGLAWPSGHVSGPDNGVVDYPVRFYALVLDRPGSGPGSGQIYVDDISAWQGAVSALPTPVATVPATQPTSAAPTTAPPTGEIGRIVFTVKVGESYYLYSTDPAWSQMVQIGLTDYAHSTCAGAGSASTLEGFTVNLYGVSKCNITDRTDACRSPDGQYEVITNQTDNGHTVTLRRAGESEILHFYYQGRLNEPLGIQWAPNSTQFLFTTDRTVQAAYISGPGYAPIIPELSDAWPPQFTPDGALVYYLKPVGAEGASDIFVVGPDGSNPRNLTNAPSAFKMCPRWRP
jgi:serine/threonine-protein kinase